MQQNGVDADRFLYSVQSASPAMKEAPEKCFFLAKKFLQNGEHEQAKRHVSAYLGVKERDPKAHRLLGLIFEKERDVNKAVGCYKRSVDLDPRQKDVVLRVAELLCNLPETDSRADFWVDKAAKLLPNHPIVFKLKEKLLSAQGQRGRNQLFDLLKSQLKVCPSDPYINVKLVQLYCSDGQLKEAVDHCLAVEKKRDMRYSLDWYSTVTQTIQEYLTQPSVLSNHSLCSMLRRELLLAHCNLLRQTLFEPGVEQSVKALQSFDQAMQSVKMASGNTANGLTELVSELRGHLYLYAGTFFLKMVHNREYQKKPGVQLASLCYLLAYQIPRPKSRPSKGEPAASRLLDLLASDRKSQSGHMLLSLAQQGECFKEIVENLCNEPGKKLLFEDLFGSQCPAPQSFIANDNIHGVSTKMPEISDLEKLDSDAVLLCGESLQQLTWLGLQLVHLGRRPCFGAWLKKLFPRHIQETFKLDSNATESICLLDLEVFLCGVVFTSPLLQAGHGVLPPCCLPLQIIGQLATERQSEWWDDACCFINRKVTMSNTARVQKTIQCGLDTLKGIGKLHGLQPALLICWAQHLSYMGHSLRSCDKRAYIGRSVHYWAVVKPLLQDIKANRSIPIPLKPLFPHVRDKDIQVSSVVGYENEAETVFAVLQDIKGNTEHAISILEDAKTISAFWHLAQIFRRCSEEAANSSEKAEYLRKIWKCLTKVCQADAADLEKVQLPISMEELMDWLSEVRQQLGEGTGALEDEAGCQEQPGTGPIFVLPEPSDPSSLSSRSLPAKSVASPSKRLVFSPKTPPQWAEDQTSMFQMLFQEMEALTNELHNWSGSMASANPRAPGEAHTVESHGESFSPAQNLHGAPLTVATTGLSGYCSQPPAYDSQYLLRTATNVTPTKAPVYRMNSLPPQPRIYPHDQLYGAPLHFDQPAPSLLSPYGEDYYSHAVSQSTTNPTLPEPGYFTKSRPQSQPLKCEEEKFPDLGFGQPSPAVPLRAGVITQSTTAAAFKFNSNFKSNDGDFTFSSAQAKNNEILRPLTSDMHIGTEGFLGEKRPNEDQTPGHSVIFSFGCKDSSGISPTSATQGPSNQSIFVEKEKPFTFTGMSKVMDRVDKANRKQRDEKGMESDNDSTRVEEDEDGPHFEPIIPLPDKVDVKTGEEEEEEIFCSRAKLFRFESDSKEWKERGIGSVKILRHKTSSKVRLLMRRDQVLKICANHYITEDMELKLNAGSDRSWVWHAVDYADEIPKPEQLAIRFKTVEEAALFKGKFDQARMSTGQDQKQMKSADVKGFVAPIPALGAFTFQFGEHFQKTSGSNSASLGFGSFPQIPTSFKFGTSTESATADNLQITKKLSPKISSEDTAATVKPVSSSSSIGFGAQFTKKPGQWDCDTCSIMNEATASGFGAQFTKKPGQWDCDTCSIMNEATATSCIACQAPNPNRKSLVDSTSAVKPASSLSSSGFGAQFTKMSGQWDCDTCAVRNEATAACCMACQAPNPCKKSSQWDCDTCAVRNEATAACCMDCQAPNPCKKSSQWDCDTCAVRNEATAACCMACQTPNPCKKSSQWDCDSCAVRNEASATRCISCQAPFKIQMLEGPWDCEKCLTRNEFSSSHCVSCGTPNSSAKVKATPLLSGFILNPKSPEQFPRFSAPSTFKFGQADDKGPHSSKVELKSATSSSSSGFSFSMPIPTGGFKFGIQEPVKEPTFESFPKNHSNESKEKGNHGTDVTKSYFPAQGEQGESPVLHFKPYTLPLADLTRSSQGDFQFEHKDPEFKDFTQAGEQVFTSLQPPVKINSSVQDEDDMYKTEENDDIQFEPVVKMPEKVDLVTGEENEDVLYSQRVKLFRFDADSSQWKERGVGNLKFLKNKENGRLRVLMRRDQVLKVCANHWINTTMNLKPLSGSDRAWMWLANDFSDGDAKPEQLAAKFKTPDLAKEFKLKFEECQKLLLDIPLQTPHKLIDSGRTAHLIQKAEEMKSGLKHLKSFLTDDKAKISQDEGQVSTATAADTSRLVLKSNADSTIPTLEWEDYNLQKEPLHDSSEASLCASPSSNSPVQRALFRFGESTSDFNFSFQPIVTPTKSPSRVNQSRVSVGTDEESETTQEDDRDGQFFEPIVPLPDLVDISTGEENEQVVFIHRAKLFRYAKDLQQWKERGIGDIKILQNDDSKRVRLVMRRDQVLKLCANHWITSSMKLEPMKGAEKAWVWSAFDFAEGKGNIEQLAVRFKLQEVANSFKDAFEKAKDAQENKVLVSPISPGEAPSQEALCQKPAAVMLKETSQENLSHGSCTPDNMTAAPFMAHSHNLSAAVVSPPKFVFGSDSVQKIFGSPSSCTQNVSSKIKPKEKALTASSPSFKISVSASQPSLSPMMPAFRVPEGGLDFRLFKDNPMAFWTSAASNRFKPQVASESKGRTDIADTSEDVEDVQVVFVREPTSEQARLARELLLPITFFCYQNEPDYISDDEDDDEDFDTAVRKLNGRLYPSNPEGATVQEKALLLMCNNSNYRLQMVEASLESSGKWLGDGVATCERVPVTELGRDKCLQHPHTEADKGVQRREQLSLSAVSSSSDTPVATVNMTKGVVIVPESQPDSTSDAYPVFVAGDSCPIDLSAKKSDKPDSTSKDTFSFGIQSVGGVSFADLANSSGEYAFGKQDSSFTWANAGAAVFGIGTVSQRTEDEASDDAEAPSSDDVHFEPIVHLPEVEIKSGEEDEEVLFKARAKLYRWDRALCQWKERGVGDLKILCQQQKCYYRVLMRREQVLKVCANHTITTAMELKPMSSSSNALVWTATDYSEENPKVEQLAAKFKNEELADTFKKMFELCQSHLTQVEPSQTPGHLEFTSKD
nr:E3 SUMO-protein ligase RanBP2 [Paramormyrops kingsleyae]